MGEMSNMDWLIGLFKHAICALYFQYLLLLSISKILASSQPLHRHAGLILLLLEDLLRDCAKVHRAIRLELCLFRQCSFCHILRECKLIIT
jgi:hypothetical protein